MKKFILLLSLSLTAFSFESKAQALEIIDAIAGTLLPRVVDGIKEIKNSGNENKVKYHKTEFQAKMNDLNQYIKGITSSIANDAKSLDAIGKVAANASLLYDDLGAMESFANGNLIDAVINSNNEPIQRQFALAFDRDLAQLKQNIDGVKGSVLALSIDQSLKDNLASLVDVVKTDYTDFESYLLQSGVTRPTATSTIDQIVSYLRSIKNSGNNIDAIKRAIQSMLSTLNSRLSSYVTSAADTKTRVDAKFAEIIQP